METRCEVESDEFVFSHLKMPKPLTTRLISVLHGCITEYDPVFFVFFFPHLKIKKPFACKTKPVFLIGQWPDCFPLESLRKYSFICLFSERRRHQSVAMQPHQHAAGLPGRHSEVGGPAPLCPRGHTSR